MHWAADNIFYGLMDIEITGKFKRFCIYIGIMLGKL